MTYQALPGKEWGSLAKGLTFQRKQLKVYSRSNKIQHLRDSSKQKNKEEIFRL